MGSGRGLFFRIWHQSVCAIQLNKLYYYLLHHFSDHPQVLNHWFESEPLRATLATDSVIGANTSPNNPGSG